MRSGGISRPPRATTFSMAVTSAGCFAASGSNLKNSGSTTSGSMKHKKKTQGPGPSPKKDHPPRAARAAAHRAIEHPDGNAGQSEDEQFALGPVPEPGAPALDGLLEFEGKVVAVEGDGQLQRVDRQQQQGREDVGLQDAAARGGFGEVAQARGDAPG